MHKITLIEEYRLIERSESEVSGSWKGAHLLLFFLAFVFGSFCTFCFHMLMYLFDEKCVLFPKLISISSVRQKTLSEFLPFDKDVNEMLPVDFLSTQWVDKTVCYLPTYVPLVSGIFGLVWTTMFLMCSTGSRTLTGLQRPWRVLPPVFIFSLAMGGLCVYASTVTQYGLQELCVKLGEFTGSTTCSYTINIATLAYERRIRGVFQATRLTILSAWLHTFCWLLSALLALVRVLLAVDFQLVKINVQLSGDIDKMLEQHERQVRSVSPSVVWFNKMEESFSSIQLNLKQSSPDITKKSRTDFVTQENEIIKKSELNLVAKERKPLPSMLYQNVPESERFIITMLYNLIDDMDLPDETKSPVMIKLRSSSMPTSDDSTYARQYGQQLVRSTSLKEQLDKAAMEVKQKFQETLNKKLLNLPRYKSPAAASSVTPAKKALTSSKSTGRKKADVKKAPLSFMNSGTEPRKSNLRHKSVQTDKKPKSKKDGKPKVQISDIKSENSTSSTDEVDKETQTKVKKKDKQD